MAQFLRSYEMYKQCKNTITNEIRTDLIHRISDNAFIPFDPDNTDYQAFLLWKAQGNETLPADEPQA